MLLDMKIPPISVVGIGNILMQDEGLGVRAIEYLKKHYKYDEDKVQVLDGGTLGLDLLPYIGGTKKLLLVDAINKRDDSGKFFHFTNESLNEYFSNQISVHDLGVNDLLATLKITGEPIEDVIVMGYAPFVVDIGLDLTEEMLPLIPPLAQKIDDVVQKWLMELKK